MEFRRKNLAVIAAALAVGVLGTVSVLESTSCNKTEEAPVAAAKAEQHEAAPPPPASPPKAAAPAVKVGSGFGTVRGVVTLQGAAPSMPALKRGADPVCAKTAMNDERALVENGKIANVVIRILNAPSTAPVPTEKVVIDQIDCMYRPRVQLAVYGQPVVIRNADGTLHNVHSFAQSHTLFNQAQPPKSNPVERSFSQQEMSSADGVVKLKCDVHPWMTGYLVLSNTPFQARSDAKGTFEISGVPAGQYTLEAWHEMFGTKKIQVTVSPNQTADANVTYSADDRG